MIEFNNDGTYEAIPNGNINVIVTFADQTATEVTLPIVNGRFNTTVDATGKFGIATVNVTFEETPEYQASNASDTINVLIPTFISVEADESTLAEGLTITGTLVYDDGQEHNMDGVTVNVKVTYENGQTDNFTADVVDGEFTVTREALAAGNVTIDVEFEETDVYAGSSDTTNTTISEKTLITPVINYVAESPIVSGEPIEIDAELGYYNEETEFVTIPGVNVDIVVAFNDGTNTTVTNVTGEDGRIITSIDTTGKVGTATVTITSVATDDYESANATADIVIVAGSTIATEILFVPDDIYYQNRTADISGLLTYGDEVPFASQEITVTIVYDEESGKPESYTATTDENGEFTVTINPQGFGQATITAYYAGNVIDTITYNESESANPVEIVIVEYDVAFDDIETEYDLNSTVEITGQVTSNLEELDVSEVNIIINDEDPFTVDLDDEGKFSFVFNGTDAGDYEIVAEVEGATDTLTIHIDQEWSQIVAEADEDTIYIGDEVIISGYLTVPDTLEPIADANITIIIDGTPVDNTTTDEDGFFIFALEGEAAGEITVELSFEGNNNYYASELDEPIVITVLEPVETIVTIDDIADAQIGEPVTITGKLTDSQGNPLAYEIVAVIINGTAYPVATNENGTYSLEYIPLATQTKVNVFYPGNEGISPSNATTIINAAKRDLAIVIINTNNNAKVNDQVEIAILLVDGDKIVTVETLKINGSDVEVKDMITKYNLTGTTNGTVTIPVVFVGNDIYNDASNSTNITFNNLNTQIVSNDNSVQTATINDTITLSVDVIDENGQAVKTGSVTFTSEGRTIGTANVTNGKASITTNFTSAGTKDVTVSYTSPENYNSASNNYTVKAIIEKVDADINVTVPTDMKVGESKDITVNAPNYPNGQLEVTIGDEKILARTDANGKATIPFTPTEIGSIPVTVTIPESEDYSQNTVSANMIVAKGNVTMTVTPTTQSVAYPNNATYTITLTDSQGKAIAGEYIKVDGVAVNMTDSTGKVVAKVSKDAGNYSIKVEYAGNENYNAASQNVVLNVTKATVTMTVSNVTGKVDETLPVVANFSKAISGGNVTFTDKDGKSLGGAPVVDGIAVAYVTFDKAYNGIINAKLTNNKNYADVNATGNAKIDALDTVITVDPISKATPGVATNITGKVTDENGKPVAGVPVTVSAGGKNTTVQTDANGNYKVPYTPTSAGDNTVTVSVPATNSTKAKTVTQTIPVNKKTSKLTVPNINAVTVGNNITVTGTLTDGNSKAIANAKVTVNIDGTSVTATTNSNGAFNASAKSTDVGKATVTVSYAGDSNYEASAAVVKSVNVNKHTTTTSVTKATGKVNANVTVKATVKSTDNTVVNDGYVVFTDNKGKQLGAVKVSSGAASLKVNYTTAFTGNVTASYTGADNFTASTGKNSITISKLNTKVTINPVKGKLLDAVNVTVKVVDENNKAVTGGEVIFKLNGKTLVDANNKTITAKVYDGVAVAQIVTNSSWKVSGNSTKSLTAKYNGNNVYNANESASVNVNLTTRKAQVTISSDRIIAHGGDNISITAVITDEGKMVDGGVVIFKIAGQTVKDKNGNTLKIKVVKGYATLNYSIEIGASAKSNMTVEAVYSNGDVYDRATNTSQLSVLKADVYFNTTIAYAKNGKAVINVTLRDAFGNLCVLDTLVAIKVDGSTFTHVTADDGKVYTTIDVSKLKKGVHTIEYVAGANNRYNSARYTNALVIE
jgi:protocatechuate 3,4-dioxygenase beta subunit